MTFRRHRGGPATGSSGHRISSSRCRSRTCSAVTARCLSHLRHPIELPTGRYVKGLEFHPGVPRAVHHANVKIDRTRSSRRLDDDDPGPGFDGGGGRGAMFPDGHFLGWTPGQAPHMLADTAWRLDAGSDLVVEVHMVPTGKPERVQVRVGLFFTDEPPSRVPYMMRLGRQSIDIPAGTRITA